MKSEVCIIIEELLPLYVENISSEQANDLIEKHLESCEHCNEIYQKMKTNIQIITEAAKPNKRTIWYLNSIKLWYMLCPFIAFTFIRFNWKTLLYYYEGVLILFSLFCIVSELYHRGTWWDPECINLQREGKKDAKRKWGIFYTRPILLAVPSILIVILMELPKFISFVSTFIF